MIKTFKSFFKRIVKEQTGTSATEYGVIIAGVALALIFVFFTVTGAFDKAFQVIMEAINNAFN